MAVRSNVGNVVTNGMQILSVSATNAADRFSPLAQKQKANAIYQAGQNDMYLSELSNTYGYGASDIAKAKARDTANWISGENKANKESSEDISEALEDTPTAEERAYEPLAQNNHTENIANKVNSDIDWNNLYKQMGLTRNAKGQFQRINEKEKE